MQNKTKIPPPSYGKVFIEESYAGDVLVGLERAHRTTAIVDGVLGTLEQIGAWLKDMELSVDRKMTFTVVADPETLKPKLVKRELIVERDKK